MQASGYGVMPQSCPLQSTGGKFSCIPEIRDDLFAQ